MIWAIRDSSDDNSLTHYGVKGMKWGVRKEYEAKGRKTKGITLHGARGGSIRTEVGTVKVKVMDEKEKETRKWILDVIDEQVPDRYAPIEEAREKLNELDSNRYTMAYTRGHSQASLTNHNAPYYIRTINCFECSMAFEMRNRGYNVQAKEMNGGFVVESSHAFDIKDSFSVQIDLDRKYAGDKSAAAKEAYDQIAKQCLSYGNGARGCIGVQWANYDSGHSMYWVVENGEFKIIDAQDSRRNGYEVFMSPADAVDHEITVDRLDNAELLPGVTDFVEPYSAVTDEEREKAAQKKNKPTLNVIQDRNKAAAKRNPTFERAEQIRKNVATEKEKRKPYVKKLVEKVGKVTSDLVSKGKNFLKNPLNIQSKIKTTSSGSFNNGRTTVEYTIKR